MAVPAAIELLFSDGRSAFFHPPQHTALMPGTMWKAIVRAAVPDGGVEGEVILAGAAGSASGPSLATTEEKAWIHSQGDFIKFETVIEGHPSLQPHHIYRAVQ